MAYEIEAQSYTMHRNVGATDDTVMMLVTYAFPIPDGTVLDIDLAQLISQPENVIFSATKEGIISIYGTADGVGELISALNENHVFVLKGNHNAFERHGITPRFCSDGVNTHTFLYLAPESDKLTTVKDTPN